MADWARFEVWQTDTGDGWSWTLKVPDGRDVQGPCGFLTRDDAVKDVKRVAEAACEAAGRYPANG